jgi:hypothetical protein
LTDLNWIEQSSEVEGHSGYDMGLDLEFLLMAARNPKLFICSVTNASLLIAMTLALMWTFIPPYMELSSRKTVIFYLAHTFELVHDTAWRALRHPCYMQLSGLFHLGLRKKYGPCIAVSYIIFQLKLLLGFLIVSFLIKFGSLDSKSAFSLGLLVLGLQ